ncbi:uncharacterized protein LOC133806459 [Humulus lupulus]|uniref:uncharacterized protein LOC133806459 n=1 Tax=Humulus lupulus TaxID=3486 RepID=UPI002B40F42F|nr:uncharacterized protein LOC133806459 [Humulus lupulus]
MGICQGDPMCPLLFVIGMEYLSHIMKKVAKDPVFQFHMRCKSLRLTHLCFADGLLLFCKGDYIASTLLLRGFKLFSNTSGLQANVEKSAVYGAGLDTLTLNRIVNISGFQRILLTINSYWSQIVILHKSAVQKINQICHAYLWKGNDMFNGSGNVSWTDVCHPKKDGGLGFKDVALWNLCAMGKHVWAISNKKDNLWVKWVNPVYIKQSIWWDYDVSAGASWYWKRIVQIKNKLKQVFTVVGFQNLHLSVAELYSKLR